MAYRRVVSTAPTSTSTPSAPTSTTPATRRARPVVREMVLLGGLLVIYQLVRSLAPTRIALADEHAMSVLRFERAVGLDVELGLNRWIVQHDVAVVLANHFYAWLFLPSVLVVLVWLWRRRPESYARHRAALVVMTLIALATYWLYPMTPPRLLPQLGYVDTITEWGTLALTSASPGDGALSNLYAAMPSMHFGWALWCSVAVYTLCRRPWVRVTAVTFATLTLVVIVVTANHFVLDAAAGAIVYLVALMGVDRWRRRESQPRGA